MISYRDQDNSLLFHFAAPPCTAVDWFQRAMGVLGFEIIANKFAYAVFDPDAEGLRVSLIRNPYDWLPDINEFTRVNRRVASEITLCIPSTVTITNNYATAAFSAYAADVCLRVEDLPWAFLELLDSVGCRARESAMFKKFPMQVGLTHPGKSLSAAQRQRIYESEREFMERYDYW